MKVCLACFQAQAGSGLYCGGCGRTFGVKLCEGKHVNSPSPRVRCCTTCGSTQMTEPTRFLNLTWLITLLVGLVALGLWRWVISHLPLLGALFWHLILLTLALILNTTPCGVLGGLHRLVCWLMTLWMLGWMLTFLPGKGGTAGTWLRALPGTTLKLGARGLKIVCGLLSSALQRAFWSSRPTKLNAKDVPD